MRGGPSFCVAMDPRSRGPAVTPSAAEGRLLIAVAAVLWSTSGAFTKLLTKDTFLHLNDPVLPGLVIAFYRALFAGLALLPALRPRDISFRWAMLATALCFALMNALYVLAMSL